MVGDEDPRAPYKVYEGDELRGTYETRAEARRRQQQLESEQANRPEPHRHVRIEDNSGDAALRLAGQSSRGRANPCAAGGEGTVPQELERMLMLGPCGEPSSLGTSRYLVGCPMCTVPDKRGWGPS